MRILKKTLSVLLAILMLVCTVPLSPFESMTDTIDFGSLFTWAKAAETIDYSDLTENQYMTKMLIPYNYRGCALSSDGSTPQSKWLSFYLNAEKVSSARSLVTELKGNSSFIAGVAAWKTLNFQPSDLVDDVLKEKDYYSAVIMNILNAEMKDNEILSNLNNEYSSTVLKISKEVLGVLGDLTEIDISKGKDEFKKGWDSLTAAQLQSVYSKLAENKQLKNYYDCSGKGISYFTTPR
jgi:hypothetical protein